MLISYYNFVRYQIKIVEILNKFNAHSQEGRRNFRKLLEQIIGGKINYAQGFVL